MKLTTTLNRIRACSPCASGWQTLLKHAGASFDPDTEIDLLTILASNGVQDMLWTLRATVQDSKRIASQLAIEFAEQVLPIFEKHRPDDTRPREAIQAARDYLNDKITLDELKVKRNAAAYAAADADAAYAAAYATADAADADAAYAAAYATAAAVAVDAYAAVDTAAAYAYAAVAVDAAADARKTARDKQAKIIRMILGE